MDKRDYINTFDNILSTLRGLPIWLLQGVYYETIGLMKDKGGTTKLQESDRTDLLQLFTPKLNPIGKKMMDPESKERVLGKVDEKVYSFLQLVGKKKNVIDICIINDWSLQECSEVLLECIRSNYIERTYTPNLHTTVLFITGQIKIGEFLLRKGLINQAQLDWALQVQGDMNETFDDKNKIVEVLSNLNYLEAEVVQDFLKLKEFARTKFIIEDNTRPYIDKLDELTSKIKELEPVIEEKDKEIEAINKEKVTLEQKVQSLQENFEQTQKKNAQLTQQIEEYEKKFGFLNKL